MELFVPEAERLYSSLADVEYHYQDSLRRLHERWGRLGWRVQDPDVIWSWRGNSAAQDRAGRRLMRVYKRYR